MKVEALSSGLLVGVAALLAVGLPHAAATESLPDGIEVQDDTIQRFDSETEERLWRVVHPSVWYSSDQEEKQYEIHPVLHTGHLYYGLGSWLIRLNADTGVVERRHYFPAEITSVEQRGDQLAVTVVRDGPAGDDPETTEIPFEPGGSTPEQTWSWGPQIPVLRDASLVAAPIVDPDRDGTSGDRDEVLATLHTRRKQDPSNPFYDYFIGRVLDDAGRSDEAREAYERSVHREQVHWTVLFQLAAHLDEAEHHDLADRVYERAHRQVQGLPRVEPRRWPSLVSYAMLFGWSRDIVERAVREERPNQVDRILERVAETFPRLEFTPMAWSALADWLDRQGREKLAAKWRDRGVRAAESPWPQVRGLASTVDLAIALLVGFLIAILGSAFVIGVRRAQTDESQGWLVRPRSAEMVGLIAALAVPFATLWLQQSRAETIEVIADVPIEVLNDGLASPAVEQWLEQLHPSESRDALLEDVRTMRRAVEHGEFGRIELVRHSRVLDAIRAHGRAEAWDSLMGRAGADGLERIGYDYHPAWLLAGLPGLFVLMLGGGVVAFYVPASKRVIRYVVPGAARSAGFFTPFILGVAVASLGSVVFGLDTILQRISVPSFGKHFGLQAIVDSQPVEPTYWRGWVGLSLALAAHAGTLWLDGDGADADGESEETDDEGDDVDAGNAAPQ